MAVGGVSAGTSAREHQACSPLRDVRRFVEALQ